MGHICPMLANQYPKIFSIYFYFFHFKCILFQISHKKCFFSSFFFFRKKLPIVVVRDVCPSVCGNISFRGNSLSNMPIELKIGLNVREGVVHVRNA